MSIQKGHPTSAATLSCASSLRLAGTVLAEATTASIQVDASSVGVCQAASNLDLGTRPMRLRNARKSSLAIQLAREASTPVARSMVNIYHTVMKLKLIGVIAAAALA